MDGSLVERMTADAREADRLRDHAQTLLVRAARSGRAAGMTQREIARAIGRSQPEVSRLLRFNGRSLLGRALTRNRAEVLRAVADAGGTDVRVFGSVARGEDVEGSDVDLLVELPETMSLFAIARLERRLSAILDAPVDIVRAASLRPGIRETVVAEAVLL